MIMFGQSAGGASVDMYSFAWAKDPIVYGLISESGVASNPATPAPNSSAAWWESSRKVGCGGIEAGEATLACMRSKTWQQLTDTVPRRGVIANTGFAPTGDSKIVFLDYLKRRSEGNFAKIVSVVDLYIFSMVFILCIADARWQHQL
jgi:cholinesterase